MAQSQMQDVVAHWHKLVENFNTSAVDFYEAVEEALKRREIPRLKTAYLRTNQGGILSPNREYLRVKGEQHVFDMCAAPFGTGYFFSSWVTKRRARFVLLWLLLLIVVLPVIVLSLQWGLGQAARLVSGSWLSALYTVVRAVLSILFLGPVGFFIELWLVAVVARTGMTGPEDAILTVPLIGWFYERIFSPLTYYRIDTMLMFQSAVHSAMLEVIDGLLTQKGLRALGDSERKPVSSELVGAVESPFAAMSGGAAPPGRLA